MSAWRAFPSLRRLLAPLTLLLIAASCASSSGSGDRPAGGGGEAAVEDFLARPLGDSGVEVRDASQARLPFVPVIPEALGTPVRVVAYAGGLEASSVAWVFDDPKLGEFAVVEGANDWSEAGMKTEASPVPSPGCTTAWADDGSGSPVPLTRCAYNVSYLITLDGGRTALVTSGDSFSAVTWIEPLVLTDGVTSNPGGLSLLVYVMGPTVGFTPDQAIEAANLVASAK